MTPDEVAVVLSKAALVDMRTIGEEEVMAWHEIVHRITLPDALTAVARHYGETRDRLMPSDLIRHARIVREERTRLEARHPVRELPGRFEADEERDERNKAAAKKIRREVIAPLVARMSMPEQWVPLKGEPAGAWWQDERKREEHATKLLAEQGRLHIEPDSGAS